MLSLKSEKDIPYLRQAGHILAQALDEVSRHIRPGISTLELDGVAENFIIGHGCEPSFKSYKNSKNDRPFPTTLCTSINNQVVHTPATERILQEGDIIGVDIGLKYHAQEREYFVDMAKTYGVGKISHLAKKLITVTGRSLEIGLQQIKPGNFISDIGKVIQKFVESNDFSVVQKFVGHGVGFAVHEEPRVPNFYTEHMPEIPIQKGMVLAIEPMVNAGSHDVKVLDDGWTVVTADGSLSAHFEHTVAVTEEGYEILTM